MQTFIYPDFCSEVIEGVCGRALRQGIPWLLSSSGRLEAYLVYSGVLEFEGIKPIFISLVQFLFLLAEV